MDLKNFFIDVYCFLGFMGFNEFCNGFVEVFEGF